MIDQYLQFIRTGQIAVQLAMENLEADISRCQAFR